MGTARTGLKVALTESAIKKTKPKMKPFKVSDGGGLFLWSIHLESFRPGNERRARSKYAAHKSLEIMRTLPRKGARWELDDDNNVKSVRKTLFEFEVGC